MQFVKAERGKKKARIGLCGTAGSGKTYSALVIAKQLGEKIAVIDTENNTSTIYAKDFDFDVLNLEPPFSVERYIEAIHLAESNGYDVIILDSISHAWEGEGGVLDYAHKIEITKKVNSFMAWRDSTPVHNSFINALLRSSVHIIATMRTKVDYVVEANDKGKMVPKKIGMKSIQREGMDYEFDLVFDIESQTHIATTSKTRFKEFDLFGAVINAESAKKIKKCLTTGVEVKTEASAELTSLLNEISLQRTIHELREWWTMNDTARKKLSPEELNTLTRKKDELKNKLPELLPVESEAVNA